MEIISRRQVMGIAVGALAGGALATGAAQGAAPGGEGDKPKPAGHKVENDSPYKFSMKTAPAHVYGQSSVREHKLADFPMSSTMSASLITLAEGDLREPHWHPNSDEWLFVMEGQVRMTIVDGKGQASSFECGLEDVAFTPIGFGHYVENSGSGQARVMVVHNHADFTTVNLSEWVAAGQTSVFAAVLNMPISAFANAPTKKEFIGPLDAKS
ncbi:MAG TPA: cupin domain-containing protein [Pirellulales bacterium]|nr:cupin domain-containing protein [Pirellulales bacterium]